MNIAFVGKFARFHDEEYIARSFEDIGHKVFRIDQYSPPTRILYVLDHINPDIILFAKWEGMPDLSKFRDKGVKTVCWLFDLYWDYVREERIREAPYFKADYVFTTDGGHDEKWKEAGVNHFCVRQGIYRDHCVLLEGTPSGIVFVGSNNHGNEARTKILQSIPGLQWYGKNNTNQIRGMDLNRLYAETKIVVGDSVYSPFYWSNRVVETLGRGGFLIHQDVPGLKEEYPHLITYPRGDSSSLLWTINYYMNHEAERADIVRKNLEYVREHYTMDKKCAELIRIIQNESTLC